MKRFAMAIAVCASCGSLAFGETTITVEVGREGARINPRLYGVFLEEISHGVDGGLYAEMLQNRGFEDAKAPEGFTYRAAGAAGPGRVGRNFRGNDAKGGRWVNSAGYATIFPWEAETTLPYWSLVQDKSTAAVSVDKTKPLNEAGPRSCKLEIKSMEAGGRAGISNEGFCAKAGSAAIGVKEGETYALSLYGKCADFVGVLHARMEDLPGNPVSDEVVLGKIGENWGELKGVLKGTKTTANGRFVIYATGGTGTVWLDQVSLFPTKTYKNQPNGLRADLAQMIADMKPGFVRFPGGCVVEAATVETAYNWKDTVGPVAARPERWNAWDYRRTHGMGLYEYLTFIEDMGAEPMYVAFAGQTCIYRPSLQGASVVPMEQMQPIVENYLDLVEYANGGPETKWGKMRAEAGHPAPFGLKLIEIGNENTGAAYRERYSMIFSALKEKHPEVQTIANERMRGASTVEMVDEHHYADPNWFVNNATLYDKADRNVPLYLGEIAVTSQNAGPTRGNLLAALSEGIYLMGAERNSDVVKMISYAPLLANVDGRTDLPTAPPPYWHGMIYFDSLRCYGTASYYLWKTFGNNVPSVNLATTVDTGEKVGGIAGNVGIGTWGTSAEFKDVVVTGKGGEALYTSDFAKGTDGWTTEGGRWAVADGVYRQSVNQNGMAYIGDESWTDYTVTLKAKKLAGGEGFLVAFGHKGEDKYWWNLGGWGNTRHEIELNQALVGRAVMKPQAIESDKWYEVKIEVAGRHVKCWLDGELVHEVDAPPPAGGVMAIAGRDEKAGEIVVKVINRTGKAMPSTIVLPGMKVAGTGKVTVLTSGSLQDNNSLDEPTKVAPVEKELTGVSEKFGYEVPAYSLSVIRVKEGK